MASRPDSIVIVGGGASGVLAAIHIIRRAPEPVRVTIVEPRDELGRGVAYGTRDSEHRLNTRADRMSALPDEPDHFTEWARRFTDADGRDFLPRSWYGQYLGALLEPVDHIRAEVVDVAPGRERVAVTLAGGSLLTCDRVVLAPGPSPQHWPAGLGGCTRRWIGDPWAPGAFATVRPDEPVLLVGTGLTAVDVALTLGGDGGRPITATSRHGLLPLVHPADPFPSLPLVPPARPTARSLVDWAHGLADELGDWRQVVDALRPHANEVWGALSDVERRRLLHHRRRWEVLRHRMAPSIAGRVSDLLADGRLTVVPGGIRSVRPTRGGIDVELADGIRRVGAVVNCTGPESDVRRSSHRLVRHLLQHRTVRPGPLGLGLATGVDGSIPGTDGRVWLVGALRRGHLWETTAVPDIRDQAAALPRAMWQAPAFATA